MPICSALYNRPLHADGFVIVQSGQMSGEPLYTMTKIGSELVRRAEHYDVALSFCQRATEIRGTGPQRYCAMPASPCSCSPFKEAILCGEDTRRGVRGGLSSRLAKFVVMFVSQDYERKMWPTVERRAAIERAIAQKSAYILPVRFDDTPIPGLRGTIAYQDARRRSPTEIADLDHRTLENVTVSDQRCGASLLPWGAGPGALRSEATKGQLRTANRAEGKPGRRDGSTFARVTIGFASSQRPSRHSGPTWRVRRLGGDAPCGRRRKTPVKRRRAGPLQTGAQLLGKAPEQRSGGQ